MAISLLVHLFFITLLSPTIFKENVSHASRHCLEHDKTMLLELKNELVFDSAYSTKLAQWNQRYDCCRWKGVECDGVGHVISLQLDHEFISGGLDDSSSLFRIEYLKKLNLACNYFNRSQIPRGIHKLTYLTHLNLSRAGFGGQIPIEISQLRRLISLDFSLNWYYVDKPLYEFTSMAMFLHNLTRLRELYLDGIDLSSEGSKWCRVISSFLPGLSILSLQSCSLSGPLDLSLSHLQFISILRLDGNNLSASVPNFFAEFPSLTTLSLRKCSLTGYFPEIIFQVPTLQNLDLSDNPLLSGTIPRFPHPTSLRIISLGGTNFSGSLPGSINNLKNLSELHLSNCRFSGLIPSALSNLTELVVVDLSYNFFTGSLSYVHFEGLSNLFVMDLRYNSLIGSIPISIFVLPSLQKLFLSGNKFRGQVNEFLVVNISNLVYLDLSYNQLQGHVPECFFQLQNLTFLWLSNNLFNGTFQLENLRSLPNLASLGLSNNNLSVKAVNINSSLHGFPRLSLLELASCNLSHFPDFLQQSSMELLDLSNNRIAGDIPNWIWDIGYGSLLELNLSFNMLVDLQKPYDISTSYNLQILDLHSNLLGGELPLPPQIAVYVDYSNNCFHKSFPNIGNLFLPNLRFLSLANNSLSGSLPAFICYSTNLAVLDLSINNFSGRIPPCLFEKNVGLQVLNLRRNNISGGIPNSFSPDCSLKTFDMSYNNLVGSVPLSLASCDSLAVMNVGANNIDDIFPCMLSSSLQVLVLRSNRFHGDIRCNMTWPNLRIIDISSNNFSGNLNPFSFSGWRGMMHDSGARKHKNLGVMSFTGMDVSGMIHYYWDEVTLTIKGLDLKLVKIWPEFTSIDFSCNKFHGDIPDVIGELHSLYLLNLSHNSLTGAIPKLFGNLTLLESLDLSVNQLTGEIPKELAGLTFLQVMNLSNNKLVGKIPVGSQFQTFSADSFGGNTGLCGFPLSISCVKSILGKVQSNEKSDIEWDYVFGALGYVVGLGSTVWVLLCCPSFREKYFEKVEDVFEKIFDRRKHRKRRRREVTKVGRNQVPRQ